MAPHLCVEVPLGGRLAVPSQTERSEAPTRYAICSVCHGPAAPGRLTCWSCRVAGEQLGPLPPVVPIFLFGLRSPVHRALVDYKAGATAAGRAARAAALTEMLAAWLDAHAGCLLGRASTTRRALVVPVPSSAGGRPSWRGHHPLEWICEAAVGDSDRFESAAVLHPGVRPPRRLQASAGGYSLVPPAALRAELSGGAELRGRTVLIVDDMFVSGSRAFSASAAVSRGGGRVAAIVPLGRLVRPDHNEATAAYWVARRQLAFDPLLCARCPAARGLVHTSAWQIPSWGVSERLAA